MRYLALATDYDNTLAANGGSPTRPAPRSAGCAHPAGARSSSPDAGWTICCAFAIASISSIMSLPRTVPRLRPAKPRHHAARRSAARAVHRGAAPAWRSTPRGGQGHRRDACAAGNAGDRDDPRARSRAAGDLQSRSGDGASRRHQQSVRNEARAAQPRHVAARTGRDRRRRERSFLHAPRRMPGRGCQRGRFDQSHGGIRDSGSGG